MNRIDQSQSTDALVLISLVFSISFVNLRITTCLYLKTRWSFFLPYSPSFLYVSLSNTRSLTLSYILPTCSLLLLLLLPLNRAQQNPPHWPPPPKAAAAAPEAAARRSVIEGVGEGLRGRQALRRVECEQAAEEIHEVGALGGQGVSQPWEWVLMCETDVIWV